MSFVIYKIKTTLKQIAADCYTVYALRFIISVSRWRSEKTVSHLDLGERLLMEVIHFSNGSSLCFISFVPHVFFTSKQNACLKLVICHMHVHDCLILTQEMEKVPPVAINYTIIASGKIKSSRYLQ